MAQIEHTTQIIITQKVKAYFRKFGDGGIAKQMERYGETKPLKYCANTIWKLSHEKHANELKDDTVKDIMSLLGIDYNKEIYEDFGIIKHVENEAQKDKVCEGCKGCTYYQHEYHNCQGQEKICHEYSKFGK